MISLHTDAVKEIRLHHKRGAQVHELADAYGVSRQAIWKIVTRPDTQARAGSARRHGRPKFEKATEAPTRRLCSRCSTEAYTSRRPTASAGSSTEAYNGGSGGGRSSTGGPAP